MDAGAIQKLCETYADTALIIVDETYIEFSDQPSSIAKLDQFANLVVLRTLSKSHAAAGLRCGAAVARGDVTSLLQKVLAPYPLAAPVMQAALTILKPENTAKLAEKRADIVTRRNGYAKEFAKLDDVQSVLPSDALSFVINHINPGLKMRFELPLAVPRRCSNCWRCWREKTHPRFQLNAALA